MGEWLPGTACTGLRSWRGGRCRVRERVEEGCCQSWVLPRRRTVPGGWNVVEELTSWASNEERQLGPISGERGSGRGRARDLDGQYALA